MRIYDIFCYKKDIEELEFKKFFMIFYVSNVEEFLYYNFVVIYNK